MKRRRQRAPQVASTSEVKAAAMSASASSGPKAAVRSAFGQTVPKADVRFRPLPPGSGQAAFHQKRTLHGATYQAWC